jgi:hypothetical protein
MIQRPPRSTPHPRPCPGISLRSKSGT